METSIDISGVVHTVPERCRMCYTCVRECPAKAIRIVEGQARVIHERCIGCGNCVRICSQKAKQVADSIPQVRKLLKDSAPVAAILAPSFPAEFTDFSPGMLAGMLRKLGFKWVNEVAFGADMVADRYRKLIDDSGKPYIATTCPAVVAYVEKYFPSLIKNLAPIASPMIATARVLKKLHGKNIHVVFIGPCVAKKSESMDVKLNREIDAVLTFAELREMFNESKIRLEDAESSDFDPPCSHTGMLFPIPGGMLQTARISENLLENRVVSTEGKNFAVAIEEFASGDLKTQLLEVLACNGCINGAGMSSKTTIFKRRTNVAEYAKQALTSREYSKKEYDISSFDDVDLSRRYSNRDQRRKPPGDNDIVALMQRMGKISPDDELNCGACGYDTCREHAIAIYEGFAESEMCLPYTIDKLNITIDQLAHSNQDLAAMQDALMQSERLASMGQLAAGIAHEVNNPLGIVLMYAHLLLDQLDEKSKLRGDAIMIAEQADRCRKIVAGLLHFARQHKVLREPVDIRNVVERSCKLVVKPENIALEIENNMKNPVAEIDADQVLQVFVNLVSNAYAAMPAGGKLKIVTSDTDNRVTISFSDNGTGIPLEYRNKIFEPFFTTKQIGSGSGLGLAISYGIIKMHRGNIKVESNDDPGTGPTGTVFFVEMPRKEDE